TPSLWKPDGPRSTAAGRMPDGLSGGFRAGRLLRAGGALLLFAVEVAAEPALDLHHVHGGGGAGGVRVAGEQGLVDALVVVAEPGGLAGLAVAAPHPGVEGSRGEPVVDRGQRGVPGGLHDRLVEGEVGGDGL